MRVLIVSESPDERARAGSMLHARDDVEVVEATSAREARQLVHGQDFDVLVVDGDLAPQGGYSLLYELHQAAETTGTPATPAVLLTDRPQDNWLAGWADAAVTLPTPADPFAVAKAVTALAAEHA